MCDSAPHQTSLADGVPGPLTVVAGLAYAAWWLLTRAVVPALIVFGWWLTGPAILPRRAPRRYRRHVHAGARVALVAVVVAALLWPLTTGVALVALGLGLAVTATVTRDRARRSRLDPATRPPIRTRATIRRPVAAVTHQPAASTWSTSSTRARVRRG